MNRTIKTIFVVLAVVIAFSAVQSIWAADCTEMVEGTITAINIETNSIVVNGITVKGIPVTYLTNQLNIVLVENVSYVVITAHLCPISDYLRACTISVDGGVVIDLPGR